MIPQPEHTIPNIFFTRAAELTDKPCVAHKTGGRYRDISWNEMREMVIRLGCFFISRGIEPGDRVALFSDNRYEWWICDLAILSIGAVNVPVYSTSSAMETAYIIQDASCRFAIAGSSTNLDKILQVRDECDALQGLMVLDEFSRDGITTFQQALEIGAKTDDEEFVRRRATISPDDTATFIYTSGTTGNPKGVMLSHGNLTANTMQSYAALEDLFRRPQTMLSFLPLSHAFERTVGYYLAIYSGSTVYFAESFVKILKNLREVRPTFMVSVPRLYEKLHAGVQHSMEKNSGIKRALTDWALGLARKNLPYICNDRPRRGFYALRYALAEKLVFSKIKETLGLDRIELAISGGGPLTVSDAEFFLGMDLCIIEGFGLSEASPVTHVNPPKHNKPGTIGVAMKDTEVRISDEGELLIRGPQVMQGYFGHPEESAAAFTEDGFLHTGDIASIDDEGFVTITGRIKEIIITAGGKNISPQNIESSLKQSVYIAQTAVIGDRRKFLSALIVPDFPKLTAWAARQGIPTDDHEALLADTRVRELFAGEITDQTRDFGRVEQIRRFTLLTTEWSHETDELTPTLKLKRGVINDKFAAQIEAMYS